MNEIRLGVVGLGHRGRAMFENIKTYEGVQGIAACDCNTDLWTKKFRAEIETMEKRCPDVAFYQDFDTMLEKSGINVLLVETPATCHAEFCAKALKAGIHVYSDIPSVANLHEADMLWKAQQESKALLMTGATTLGWGFVHTMQDMVRQGLLGKIAYAETEYIHDIRSLWEETPWRKPGKDSDFNHSISYCTHGLGPILSLFEEDLKTVSAFCSGSFHTDIPEAEDVNVAVYHTASGIMVRQTNSFINNWPQPGHSFRIFGSEGFFEHLSIRGYSPNGTDNAAPVTAFASNKITGLSKYVQIPVGFQATGLKKDGGHGGADSWIWEQFQQALQDDAKQAPIDLRAGLRMTLPGLFACHSITHGGVPVKITYPWDSDWDKTMLD